LQQRLFQQQALQQQALQHHPFQHGGSGGDGGCFSGPDSPCCSRWRSPSNC
jgi:hypothetical protein